MKITVEEITLTILDVSRDNAVYMVTWSPFILGVEGKGKWFEIYPLRIDRRQDKTQPYKYDCVKITSGSIRNEK